MATALMINVQISNIQTPAHELKVSCIPKSGSCGLFTRLLISFIHETFLNVHTKFQGCIYMYHSS